MSTGAQTPRKPGPAAQRPLDRLLEFRPWMLAIAVFLACAIGVAIMERSRDGGQMWAQATASDPATHAR
jgi:hypothetical protein